MDKELDDLLNKYNNEELELELDNNINEIEAFEKKKNNPNSTILNNKETIKINNNYNKNIVNKVNNNIEKKIDLNNIKIYNKEELEREEKLKEEEEDRKEIKFRENFLKFYQLENKGTTFESKLKNLKKIKLNNKTLFAVSLKNQTEKNKLLNKITNCKLNKNNENEEKINQKIENLKYKIDNINKKMEEDKLKQTLIIKEINDFHNILEKEIGSFEDFDLLIKDDKKLFKKKLKELDILKRKLRNEKSKITLKPIIQKKSLINKNYDIEKLKNNIDDFDENIKKIKNNNKTLKERINLLEKKLKNKKFDFELNKNLMLDKSKLDNEYIETLKKKLNCIYKEREKIKKIKQEEITSVVYEDKNLLERINYDKIKQENLLIHEINLKNEEKLNELDNEINDILGKENKPSNLIFDLKYEIEVEKNIKSELKNILDKNNVINIKILSEINSKLRLNLNKIKNN